MNICAPFILRPVMTTLLTIAVVLAGMLGYSTLPVSDLPSVDYPTISVSASFPGANAQSMAASVATPLEREFTAIPGLANISSTSVYGATSISLQFDLNRNIDAASQDVQAAIAKAARSLPPGMPSQPSLRKLNPADLPIMNLALWSDTMPLYEVNEYAETKLGQKLGQVNGVAQVVVYGQQKRAVRVQADPDLLAARGIGIDQLSRGLRDANSNLPVGSFQGERQSFNIQTTGQLSKAADYRDLIVQYREPNHTRLEHVANVIDGIENDRVAASFSERLPDGSMSDYHPAVLLYVYRQPGANTVEVTRAIKEQLPSFQATLPPSVHLAMQADRSEPIRESVADVQYTLLLALVLVVGVIFLFLRNVRATMIPSLALPVSVIATFGVMHLLDYTLDNISLLALTLAVGFVVDDAIVMLENIVRHLDMGKKPLRAALDGSAEVGFTIVSMTISLVAVFIPVLFLGGFVGRLLREFAVTISVAIVVSGLVSVTLTPMLCALFLKGGHGHALAGGRRPGFFFRITEWGFDLMLAVYARTLRYTLRFRFLMLLFSFTFIFGTAYYLDTLPKGFLPVEDYGLIYGTTEGPEDVSFQGMLDGQRQVAEIVRRNEHVAAITSSIGSGGSSIVANNGRLSIKLKPREERDKTTEEVVAELRRQTAGVPGIRSYFQNPPPIRIGGRSTKSLYQLTLKSSDTDELYAAAPKLEAKLRQDPDLVDVNSDLQIRSQQLNVVINRDEAMAMGVGARQIEDALANAYGSRQISTIFGADNEYQVILELKPEFQKDPNLLSRLYVRSSAGRLVRMDKLATLSRGVGPLSVNHSGLQPSVTISFNVRAGASLGNVLARINDDARTILPPGVTTAFQGTAQEFQESTRGLALLLVAAIVVIYLVMGMLYESFIHPITILSGLPSAGVGALLTLALFHSELNLYSTVGLILLIGIVKKNAIMMIDFALDAERTRGMSPHDAIYEACLVRFRPIMMTTMAALLGALPIALGLGAGAESRKPLGLAVVGGLIVSQVLTLYFTPVYYLYLDKLRFRKKAREEAFEEPLNGKAHAESKNAVVGV